jgi:hypothetical protein
MRQTFWRFTVNQSKRINGVLNEKLRRIHREMDVHWRTYGAKAKKKKPESLFDNERPDLSTRNRQFYPQNSVAPADEKAPPLPPKNSKKYKNSDERSGHPKLGIKINKSPRGKRIRESTTCAIKIMASALFFFYYDMCIYCTRDIVRSQWGCHSTKESIELASPAPQ